MTLIVDAPNTISAASVHARRSNLLSCRAHDFCSSSESSTFSNAKAFPRAFCTGTKTFSRKFPATSTVLCRIISSRIAWRPCCFVAARKLAEKSFSGSMMGHISSSLPARTTTVRRSYCSCIFPRDTKWPGAVFLTAEEILADRRRLHRFWTPVTDVEFACILANRIAKGSFKESHPRQLSALYANCPQTCHRRIAGLFADASSIEIIETAARTSDWSAVMQRMNALRDDLLANPATRRADGTACRFVNKARRWLRPRNGYHAVFLGPDGVGKSTTIETFQRDLKPAFLHDLYLTLRTGFAPAEIRPSQARGPSFAPSAIAPGVPAQSRVVVGVLYAWLPADNPSHAGPRRSGGEPSLPCRCDC